MYERAKEVKDVRVSLWGCQGVKNLNLKRFIEPRTQNNRKSDKKKKNSSFENTPPPLRKKDQNSQTP